MVEIASALTPYLSTAGVWVGFVITLMTFSLVLGENSLARLAQHLVVGASLGYATLMAAHYVVGLRVATPLVQGRWQPLALPLGLCALLVVAGLERVFGASRRRESEGRARRWLQAAGVVPLAILIGVGLAAGVAGIVQGTVIAQARAAMEATFATLQPGLPVWAGAVSLLLTTAALLSLTIDRATHVEPMPRPLRLLMLAWIWVGERALWIASGVLLARLFAARLTLLVERMDVLATTAQASWIREWLQSLLAQVQG